MAVKLRLTRIGKTKQPQYRIVASDSRSARDGRFIAAVAGTSRRAIRLEVRVGPNDLGRVIGKRGKTAQAIRTLVRAAASRDGVEVDVDFVD